MLSTEPPSTLHMDISGLRLALNEKHAELSTVGQSGISSIVPDPDLEGVDSPSDAGKCTLRMTRFMFV